MRPTISLAIIARDAEATIAAVIKSAQPFVSEVIVVDTGSEDRTADVCRQLGANVSTFEWADDFAAARNATLALCHGDWVLSLDADELLDARTARNLARLLGAKTKTLTAYAVPIRLYAGDGDQVATINRAVRLFPRHPSIRWQGRIHERIVSTDPAVKFAIAATDEIAIDHRGYAPDADSRQAHNERNLRLLEMAIGDEPEDPIAWTDLARHHRSLEQWDELIPAAVTAINHFKTQGKAALNHCGMAYAWLALALHQTGRPGQGIVFGEDGLKQHPRCASLWLSVGLCYQATERYLEALSCFAAAAECAACPDPAYQLGESVELWRPPYLAGNCFAVMGEPVRAWECYQEAIRSAPERPEPRELAQACLRALGETAA